MRFWFALMAIGVGLDAVKGHFGCRGLVSDVTGNEVGTGVLAGAQNSFI